MQNMVQIVTFLRFDARKYPLSIACWIMILYLSFFTVPDTELSQVPFIDKWAHIVMYGLTCLVMWVEYLLRHRRVNLRRMLAMAVVLPILASGAIEIVQEYCTGGRRSGDWLDLAANSLGVGLAAVTGLVYSYMRGKI